MGKQISVFVTVIFLFLLLLNIYFVVAVPSGGFLNIISNSTAPADPPQGISAFAGNVTEINIFGYSTTQSWQGYYGNVSGTIELTDGNNKTLYNWSVISPKGEVYASNHSSVVWTSIQCFNFTANGTLCEEDSENGGGTSQCGFNESQLEEQWGINYSSDVDGVNETFNRRDHAEFYTNGLQFSQGECPNTKLFNSSGHGLFDVVLLWSPQSNATVFTSLLLNNGDGFDGKTHDFEMIVLENGHGNTAISTYYFYVELQ
ncbi:MAG: hypothetical protein QXW97_00040 [Candidatus Pacearchaeota archaeon]